MPYYTIKSGDTLGAIAYRFGTTPEAIKRANPYKIKNINKIYAGDEIYVPSDDDD